MKLLTLDWDLNPHDQNLNPPKTQFGTLTHMTGTQIQLNTRVLDFRT